MDATKLRKQYRRTDRLVAGAIVVAFVIFGLTDVRRRARVDPNYPQAHKTDLTIFTGAGTAFLRDDAPYSYANPRGWKYAYPPFFALLVSPLANFDFQQQAVIWYGFSCVCGLLAWREAVRVSRMLGIDVRLSSENQSLSRVVGWAALATVVLPALNCLQRGQVGLFYLWLLLWGFRRLQESRTWPGALLAGTILALPGVIKVTPVLPAAMAILVWAITKWRSVQDGPVTTMPVAWRKHHRRQMRWLGLAGLSGFGVGHLLFLLVIPGTMLGWSTNLKHLKNWNRSIATMAVTVKSNSSLETPYTLRNQSLSNSAFRLGNWIDFILLGGPDDREIDAVPVQGQRSQLRMEGRWARRSILGLRLALLAMLGFLGWRVAWRGDQKQQAALFGLACAASLIVSPLSRVHYFVVLLPAMLWFAPAWQTGARSHWKTLMLWGPAALTGAHYLALDIAGRVGLLGIGLTLWYMAALIPLLRMPAEVAVTDEENSALTPPLELARAA